MQPTRVACDDNQRHSLILRTGPIQELKAIHDGHLNVRDDDEWIKLCEHVESDPSVRSDSDPVSLCLKAISHAREPLGLIIDNQYS